MVDNAVDDRRRHLVVAEHPSPARELEVGRDHHALPLVGVGEDLEEGAPTAPLGGQRAVEAGAGAARKLPGHGPCRLTRRSRPRPSHACGGTWRTRAPRWQGGRAATHGCLLMMLSSQASSHRGAAGHPNGGCCTWNGKQSLNKTRTHPLSRTHPYKTKRFFSCGYRVPPEPGCQLPHDEVEMRHKRLDCQTGEVDKMMFDASLISIYCSR